MTYNDDELSRIEWDPAKDRANVQKHGLSFAEAAALLRGEADFLEIYDDAHSDDEDRFIAIGPIERGLIVVVYTERLDNALRIVSARPATRAERNAFEEYGRRHDS